MNWGYKILLVYLAFAGGILFLCYKASREQFDLVEPNYYEAELKYQERIDARTRAGDLKQPVQVLTTADELQLQLPAGFAQAQVSGEVYLYCAADASRDFRQQFTTSNGRFNCALPAHSRGAYTLQLKWEANGVTYFHEEKRFL